jgi:hypothetical protein
MLGIVVVFLLAVLVMALCVFFLFSRGSCPDCGHLAPCRRHNAELAELDERLDGEEG